MIDVKELRALYDAGTYGEWFINPRVATHVQAQVDRGVASCGGPGSTINTHEVYSENEVNAILIAAMHNALPELLKMAEWCVGRCCTCIARGGTECPEGALWADPGPCPEWKPAWGDTEKTDGRGGSGCGGE